MSRLLLPRELVRPHADLPRESMRRLTGEKKARPEGFEPPTFGFEVHRSIH